MKIKRHCYCYRFSTVSAGFAPNPTGALSLDPAGGLLSPDLCLGGNCAKLLRGIDAPALHSTTLTRTEKVLRQPTMAKQTRFWSTQPLTLIHVL